MGRECSEGALVGPKPHPLDIILPHPDPPSPTTSHPTPSHPNRSHPQLQLAPFRSIHSYPIHAYPIPSRAAVSDEKMDSLLATVRGFGYDMSLVQTVPQQW